MAQNRPFSGKLNHNKVFQALTNQIISIKNFATGVSIKDTIYGSRRVDGTLYGDTKLYRSTDKIDVYDFDGTSDKYNLLTQILSPEPHEQGIVIDIFKQIPLTVGQFLVKQAFFDERSYSEFTGILLSWIWTTKNIYTHTHYTSNILVGAEKYKTVDEDISVLAPTDIKGYDKIRFQAQEFYRKLEDKAKEVQEPSREYNSLGFMRTVDAGAFDYVIPIGLLSQVRKQDVPFLFNPDEKIGIKEIHWKYFGEINDEDGTTLENNNTVRSLIERDYAVDGETIRVLAGDLLPDEVDYLADETYTSFFTETPSWDEEFPVYMIHKQDFPILDAMTVNSSFYNAHLLTQNHYLTFGHNNVKEAHLDEYPLFKYTVKVK